MSERQITGRQVFFVTAAAFGVIIAVNVTLAVKAVQTFPGLEVKNSYVASQTFDAERAAQQALGWQIDAALAEGALTFAVRDRDGLPVRLASLDATLGRATHIRDDVTPEFSYQNGVYVARVDLPSGYWNLRVRATAPDGTPFQQRIELYLK